MAGSRHDHRTRNGYGCAWFHRAGSITSPALAPATFSSSIPASTLTSTFTTTTVAAPKLTGWAIPSSTHGRV